MTDEYIYRDDEGIVLLDGDREGHDRRMSDDRRSLEAFEEYGRFDRRQRPLRREPGERRIGPVHTLTTIFHEHLSSFIIGTFLLVTGVLMLITGLTFLPVIGLYAGVVVIFIGGGFLLKSLSSSWP